MPEVLQMKSCPLKFLVVITDRSQMKNLRKLICDEDIGSNFICLAQGTAGSEILDMLGLVSTDKAILGCLETQTRAKELLSIVMQKFNLKKAGGGIAFTLPLTSVNSSVLQALSEKNRETEKRGVDKLECETSSAKYELIVAMINQGHMEKLMDAAKAAGAKGGTMIHGIRSGTNDDAKFFGSPITIDKEIVTILVPAENKHAIMNAISASSGMQTEAQGTIFSLPVDEVVGLGKLKI